MTEAEAIEACIGVMGNVAFRGSYAAPREAFRRILLQYSADAISAYNEGIRKGAEIASEYEKVHAPATPATPGFDEATETRWQNAIYELCKKSVGPENDSIIDGGGSDSGDALDFTLSEIGQALAFWQDKVAEAAPTADPKCECSACRFQRETLGEIDNAPPAGQGRGE